MSVSSTTSTQGSKIADRGDGWIGVETASWCMTAHAVVKADDEQVSLALFARFDNPMAAIIWALVSRMHRRGAPVILRQAIRAHESESFA
ncbi:MAG TPA: hypothetical protein VNG12_18185 [Acidimicrobiales bacterium]|nr:hypothetical protein [Acidimicrobiales bacterium]